jgi:hypothetical protein
VIHNTSLPSVLTGDKKKIKNNNGFSRNMISAKAPNEFTLRIRLLKQTAMNKDSEY